MANPSFKSLQIFNHYNNTLTELEQLISIRGELLKPASFRLKNIHLAIAQKLECLLSTGARPSAVDSLGHLERIATFQVKMAQQEEGCANTATKLPRFSNAFNIIINTRINRLAQLDLHECGTDGALGTLHRLAKVQAMLGSLKMHQLCEARIC